MQLRTKKEKGKCCHAKPMEIGTPGSLGSKGTATNIRMLLVETSIKAERELCCLYVINYMAAIFLYVL